MQAVNITFAPSSLSAPAGTPITVTLQNQDNGLAHNINFFAPGTSTSIGATDVVQGVSTQTLSLGSLAPGSYHFKCDVHPTQMSGTLVVS